MKWNRDMSQAPIGETLRIACRIRLHPPYVHRWCVTCVYDGPNFLDWAWRLP